VDNVLSIPGAINLVKDTATGKLRVVKIRPDGAAVNVDSFKKTFFNLPFYRGFLYNAETNAWMMAVRIDKQVLNSKNRTGVVNEIVAHADSFAEKHGVAMHYSGLPLIRTMMATQVQSEMQMFLIMSFLLTAFILALFFRSF